MPFSENLIQRYLKVHALVERGATADERATAARVRGELEREHPGIGVEATRWKDEQERRAKPTAPPPPAAPPTPAKAPVFVPSGVEARPASRWADAVEGVFQAAQGIAAQALGAEVARRQAESMVRIERTHSTRQQMWRIAVLMHDLDRERSQAGMSDSQKQAFARAVGEQIAVQVYSLISE